MIEGRVLSVGDAEQKVRKADVIYRRTGRAAAQKEDGCQCLFRYDPKPVIS